MIEAKHDSVQPTLLYVPSRFSGGKKIRPDVTSRIQWCSLALYYNTVTNPKGMGYCNQSTLNTHGGRCSKENLGIYFFASKLKNFIFYEKPKIFNKVFSFGRTEKLASAFKKLPFNNVNLNSTLLCSDTKSGITHFGSKENISSYSQGFTGGQHSLNDSVWTSSAPEHFVRRLQSCPVMLKICVENTQQRTEVSSSAVKTSYHLKVFVTHLKTFPMALDEISPAQVCSSEDCLENIHSVGDDNANPHPQTGWIESETFIDSESLSHVKISDNSDYGSKFGISLPENDEICEENQTLDVNTCFLSNDDSVNEKSFYYNCDYVLDNESINELWQNEQIFNEDMCSKDSSFSVEDIEFFSPKNQPMGKLDFDSFKKSTSQSAATAKYTGLLSNLESSETFDSMLPISDIPIDIDSFYFETKRSMNMGSMESTVSSNISETRATTFRSNDFELYTSSNKHTNRRESRFGPKSRMTTTVSGISGHSHCVTRYDQDMLSERDFERNIKAERNQSLTTKSENKKNQDIKSIKTKLKSFALKTRKEASRLHKKVSAF